MLQETERHYQIQLLGSFRVQCGSGELNESAGRMQQVWNLLEYLIVFRNSSISQSALIDALWPYDGSDNPSNALKNLAYRARTLLSKAFPEETAPFIVFKRNAYSWNNDLSCSVDIEELERSWKIASSDTLPNEERLAHYNRALDLYHGQFLPKSGAEEWTLPLRAYYRSIYLECVDKACVLLLNANRPGEVIRICGQATSLEPFEERLHELLIRGYLEAENHTQALAHYYQVTNMFYSELGIKVSDSITNLYREITKSVSNVEADLRIIEQQLHESEAVPGAFFCDYEVFRNIYRIQSRSILRTGQSFMLALLTVSDGQDNVPNTQLLTSAMEALRTITVESLRRSDVVSRFSPSQYVLLLGCLTYENGELVLRRICNKFSRRYRSGQVKLHTNLHPLQPVSQ